MASGSPVDGSLVMNTTENSVTEDAKIASQVPDAQLKAIKKVIDNLYAHREPECVADPTGLAVCSH